MFISIFIFSFLHLASNGINPGTRKLILIFNFHYWMKIEWTKGTRTPLPFRHQNVNLPNNREQTFKRMLWQKKKMIQNEKYRNDYVAFINDMIEKGYAEKVPGGSLRTDANNAWYIPHHGVYHPEKPEKIRVIFDCSARFCGTSLNDQLLQGPDLTNS